MSVTGIDVVLANLAKFELECQRRAVAAMDEVMDALEGWAKSEHAWGNPYSEGYRPTGDLARSISGDITEISEEIVRGLLSAGMEYAVFLELARSGKWAWLWPVVENHKDEIMGIVSRHFES